MLDLNYNIPFFHADAYRNSKNPGKFNRVVQEWPNLADTYAALLGHLKPSTLQCSTSCYLMPHC